MSDLQIISSPTLSRQVNYSIFYIICQKIIIKGSLGRSKAFTKEATIEKAYPNIFVVRYEENNSNVTYSYTDVLTRTVEVEVFDGTSYSPLIPPPVESKRKKDAQ